MDLILDLYSMTTFRLPCIIFLVLGMKCHNRKIKRFEYLIFGLIFSLYCFIAIAQVAGIGTIWDILEYKQIDNKINLSLFFTKGYLNYVLNVIMFMPLGFLLPFVFTDYRKFGKVVITGFLMSLLIEFFQLFNNRVSDIDDLTMNTLGTIIGFFIWYILNKLIFHSKNGVKGRTEYDGLILILLGSFSTFLLYNWRWTI